VETQRQLRPRHWQKKHLRPKNVNNLQVPKVEEQLQRQLKPETKAFDYTMQKSQSPLCQVMVPVHKIIETKKCEQASNKLKDLARDTF